MYYRSVTGVGCYVCAGQTLHIHSSGGSTFMHEMTPGPPSDLTR